MQAFERAIYTEPNGPYTSWLETTREKVDFEAWLARHIHGLKAVKIRNRPVSVLDLGCSWGSTSFRVIRVLRQTGLTVSYTGVDPYQAQLDKFARLAAESGLPAIRLIQGTAESFQPDQDYDLVIASHMLYYTSNMRLVLETVLRAGREAIIVHHGKRGINTVHEAFRKEVCPGPHVISTDGDVADILSILDRNGRRSLWHTFPSMVNIASCADPNSPQGRNLISFFLERNWDSIPNGVSAAVREFLCTTYAPHFLMTHDVGIFVVT